MFGRCTKRGRDENMAKYRKRPVVVEAEQFKHGQPRPAGVFDTLFKSVPIGFHVVTIHGDQTKVVYDDWIITEPDGVHHYPCKPDIFAATYEPVESAPDRSQQWGGGPRPMGWDPQAHE